MKQILNSKFQEFKHFNFRLYCFEFRYSDFGFGCGFAAPGWILDILINLPLVFGTWNLTYEIFKTPPVCQIFLRIYGSPGILFFHKASPALDALPDCRHHRLAFFPFTVCQKTFKRKYQGCISGKGQLRSSQYCRKKLL